MHSSAVSYSQLTHLANADSLESFEVHKIVYVDTRINSAGKVPAAPVQAA